MTTPTPRWTAATESAVTSRIGRFVAGRDGEFLVNRDLARMILADLADAGVLTAVGGETRRWEGDLAWSEVLAAVANGGRLTIGVRPQDLPHAHPEDYCHRCGGPNIPWSAPSPLWNAVMRGGSINGDEEFDGIVCPTCFAVLAEQRGIAHLWRLSARRVQGALELVTPSGRVWDEAAWIWREVTDDPA